MGHVPPNSGKYFWGSYHVKFGNFVNFLEQMSCKIWAFCFIFSGINVLAPKFTELLRPCPPLARSGVMSGVDGGQGAFAAPKNSGENIWLIFRANSGILLIIA